jgi:hypothetical protein
MRYVSSGTTGFVPLPNSSNLVMEACYSMRCAENVLHISNFSSPHRYSYHLFRDLRSHLPMRNDSGRRVGRVSEEGALEMLRDARTTVY